MHGLGNDFIVLNAIEEKVSLTVEQIRFLSDRKHGIGFDQLLIVEPSDSADFKYRIFNANGYEVEQCGNGARCFADYVLRKGLTDKTQIDVETYTRLIRISQSEPGQYAVDMGVPVFIPGEVPFMTPYPQSIEYPVMVMGKEYLLGVLSVGNPHAVLLVDQLENAPVAELGPAIERHADFPAGVNVGFLQVISRNEAKLRVWERGVGETQACGTGACAAMISGKQRGLFDEQVLLHLLGGDLQLSWPGVGESVTMSGPAAYVFDGVIEV